MPQIAETDEEIVKCFSVMSELRPNLERNTFLHLIHEMGKQGYQLAFIEENNAIMAVAGFRVSTNLFMGKNFYVDDLVITAKQRSKSYGEKMLSWLRDIAIEKNCNYFHLDSGTHRHSAHKFYFRNGLSIASYHFSENLKDDYQNQ